MLNVPRGITYYSFLEHANRSQAKHDRSLVTADPRQVQGYYLG